MPARVVDSSVLSAWCFREPRAAEAHDLMKGYDLHAPRLLGYELVSVARQKVLRHPGQAEALITALQVALSIPILWGDVDHLVVLDLAMEVDLTTYDASYLYLARRLGIELVTFDEELLRASRDAAALDGGSIIR
jgi:predicted nucleic acid-binding protein